MTHYCEDEQKTKEGQQGNWCCANTHLYGIEGWKKSEVPEG
jgi:hypothetical protein